MMNWSDIRRKKPDGAHTPVVVNVPDKANLLTDLKTRLAHGRGFCIAALNLDQVVKFHCNKAFHDAYTRHSIKTKT